MSRVPLDSTPGPRGMVARRAVVVAPLSWEWFLWSLQRLSRAESLKKSAEGCASGRFGQGLGDRALEPLAMARGIQVHFSGDEVPSG